MTITRCDRCGKEMKNMSDVHIVQGWPWDRPHLILQMELCEGCFKCWIDWPEQKEGEQ